MQRNESRLTVFFEDPFWVGVYERIAEGALEVCKITFGAEPRDCEVYDFLMKRWDALEFSPPVRADLADEAKISPKRLRRAAKKQLSRRGTGTKSQQALQLQYEERKAAGKERRRKKKGEDARRKFELRQEKRREKRKGR